LLVLRVGDEERVLLIELLALRGTHFMQYFLFPTSPCLKTSLKIEN